MFLDLFQYRLNVLIIAEVFEKAKNELQDHIVKWGYLETKEEFIKTLRDADVAVSTAIHEFFGVSM